MAQKLSLAEIASDLSAFDRAHPIFAAEPWTAISPAIVVYEADSGAPAQVRELGLSYFLEIDIAIDVVEGLVGMQARPPDGAAICQRLIDYAVNDA